MVKQKKNTLQYKLKSILFIIKNSIGVYLFFFLLFLCVAIWRVIDIQSNNKEDNSRKVEKEKLYLIVKGNILSDNGDILRTTIKKNNNYKRYNTVKHINKPHIEMARSILGYVRKEKESYRGLDFSFREFLGEETRAKIKKLGKSIWVLDDKNFVNNYQSFSPGKDIQTTLNSNMQYFAEDLLIKYIKEYKAMYGVIILMEVETGEIKVMANMKNQNNKIIIDDYNYAVGNLGRCHPGSTFKAVSMLSALEEGIKPEDTLHVFKGKYVFHNDEGCVFHDEKHNYDVLKIKEIFEISSNVGMSRLLFKIFNKKEEKLIQYFKKFGIYDNPFFELEGVAKPQYFTPASPQWSGCSIPSLSIGYSITISPLHLLSFYNAVANQGKLITPIIVKSIKEEGKVVKEFKAKVLRNKIASDSSIAILQKMLSSVIEGSKGTARGIRSKEYKIAGKTGTARREQEYNKNNYSYYTSFIGYFPAQKPKYTCIVAIDYPQVENAYGGSVCAPIFRKLADYVYENYVDKNIEDMPIIEKKKKEKVVNKDSKVPNVIGMTLRTAVAMVENRGIKIKVIGRGDKITKQYMDNKSKTIILQL